MEFEQGIMNGVLKKPISFSSQKYFVQRLQINLIMLKMRFHEVSIDEKSVLVFLFEHTCLQSTYIYRVRKEIQYQNYEGENAKTGAS